MTDSRQPLRIGTWRQGLLTFAGVLPVSLVLNLALAPLLAGLLPHLAIVAIDAAILVAALNWVLLPALHWVTNGWAVRSRTSDHVDGERRSRVQESA
ncbi:hypothetical protein [Gryllotalpicola koreensis]|uniref:Uncharacterized protein n=1 Tax=Gryllotalpicola koreensis TaxID=993086 RepID=A0ABP8A5F7_9MICO